jgi:hypothetical protein
MRHSLFSIILIFIFLIDGCKTKEIDVRKALIGNWDLRRETVGIKNHSTDFPADSVINLVVSETKYSMFSQTGQMVSMGHYRIIADTMKSSRKVSNRLIFKPEVYYEDTGRFFISINNNQLIITEDSVGGTTLQYERVN